MNDFDLRIKHMDELLRIGTSFDMIKKPMTLGCGARAVFYYIDGFVGAVSTAKLMEYFMSDVSAADCIYNIPFVEAEPEPDEQTLVTFILAGAAALLVEGIDEAAVIDSRGYPTRSISEPENDRVLRGARDGFCETLVFNTALIRRRLRDPRLTVSLTNIGRLTRTDVAVCYIDGIADPKFVASINKRIAEIAETADALPMAQESLAELLVRRRWYNPFPKIRYTERPDSAAAMLSEGSIIIITDTSPSVMILPTGILDFTQEADDFYFPPLTGSYMRFIRIIVTALTLLLTPTWYLLISYSERLPEWLEFIRITEPAAIPLFVQLFIGELVVDGLKLASLNTPSMLSSSFSAISGLLLGDLAVSAGYFSGEVILYTAFVSIANFTQSSYELGYALKLSRMLLLILTAAFRVWGYMAGIVIILLLIATNAGVSGSRGYLYPLIPFNGKALLRLLIRERKR